MSNDAIELHELLARYAVAVDEKDIQGLTDVFAPTMRKQSFAEEGTTMAGLFARDPRYDGETAFDGPEYAAGIVRNMAHMGTQHVIGDPRFALRDADHAGLTGELHAPHWRATDPDGGVFEVLGRYEHDVERIDGRWRITVWRLRIAAERGDPSVMVA
jgi:hypothetical protein